MTLLQDDGDGNAGSGREMTPIGATPTPPSASKSPRLLSPTGDSMSMSSRGNTLTPSMDDFGGGGASRDATLNSLNSSSGSGSRVVQIRRTYDTMDRTQSPSPSEEEPSAYLCCSKEEPDQFQIDLCPRAWFCCCESTAVEDQEACSLTAAETGEAGPRRRRTGPRPGVFTVLWRVCFVIFCLPLCYPCYLTRKCRRREKRYETGSPQPSPTSGSSGLCQPRPPSSPRPPETVHVVKAHRKEKE